MSIREIAQNFHEFLPEIYIPPLFEFSHCFCPNFSIIAFALISGKSNGKFGQKHVPWEIRAKAMGKFGEKQWENSESGGIYFRQKLLLLPEFPIAFALISHCFCPNFLLLLPEYPTAFARIFRFQKIGGGGGACVIQYTCKRKVVKVYFVECYCERSLSSNYLT